MRESNTSDSANKIEIWQIRDQKPNCRSKFSVPITINKIMILISKIKQISRKSWGQMGNKGILDMGGIMGDEVNLIKIEKQFSKTFKNFFKKF